VPTAPVPPVRVALANDFQIIVAGLAALLEPFGARVEVVDWVLVDQKPPGRPVDVLLFDTYGRFALGLSDIEALVDNPLVANVVIYSWETSPQLVDRALAMGVAGFASKTLEPADLVAVLERVAVGERVVAARMPGNPVRVLADWPGRTQGLTARESEILALVIQGFRNEDIADALFLGINTVKTHLKSLYRKLGARNRADVVAIALSQDSFANRTSRKGPVRAGSGVPGVAGAAGGAGPEPDA
jgi:NarL family two-component system response regulator LiaR